jgi:hypothetical protein
MSIIGYSLYFPQDPVGLFRFIDEHLKEKPVFYLWVDNNDHKVSSEFYTLRKYIRKGVNIQVFINPPVNSEKDVFDWLFSKAQEQGVFTNEKT